MNPFEQIAKTLTRKRILPAHRVVGADAKQQSRVGTIRALLKDTGRAMTAAEIAFDLDPDIPSFNSGLVWLLLKHDIKIGRVTLIGGRYFWNAEYESKEQTAIRAAIKLLKKSGYTVTKGGEA